MASSDLFKTLLYTVNNLLQQQKYKTALAVVKGFRNGAVYGAKIRAPHALVMTFLFRSGSLREKFRAIAQATYTHSRNLACFVFTYKGLQALQQRLQGKTLQSHSFLAACVGGWLVFGENNNINSQKYEAAQLFSTLIIIKGVGLMLTPETLQQAYFHNRKNIDIFCISYT
ncbi:peroxisomal membrane protein 4 isoform X2 [Labeo rohita]|uniref:peroxisomal membrane protein 4 isoform X2 n=1 Tax=Labeo rohita TaxID=84645 RepID=UPI0021E2894D|nr:peroxisomal membrane protein 4 isoform X2 [Labeo rohita]